MRIAWLLVGVLAVVQAKAAEDKTLSAYVTLNEEVAQKIIQAFQKETGIQVTFERLSTGEATARMEAEKVNPLASVWLGGSALGHSEAKSKKLTTPFEAKEAQKIPARYHDPENYWHGIYIGALAFAVNKDQLEKQQKKHPGLAAPKQWSDLLDARWKGLIQLPNPGTSGTSYNLLAGLVHRDGEEKAFDYLRKLHKNVSQYTRSGEAPLRNVAAGETVVSMSYNHDILRLMKTAKALEMQPPVDGTFYEIASASLIKNGKQLENAKRLVNWMYSPKATEILKEQYISPLIELVGPKAKLAFIESGLTLFDIPIDWAGQNKQRLIELWNDKVNSQTAE